MNIDENDFMLSEEELARVQQELGVTPSVLGMRPRVNPAPAALLENVPPADRDRLDWIVRALTVPAKTVRFHYTLGDESLTRSVVAWGADQAGDVAVVAQTGTVLRFGHRSSKELTLLAANVLAVDTGVKDTVLSLETTAAGLFAWLAAVEHLQALKLSAMLRHHAPENVFNRSELRERLAEATDEDFRWPLMFLTKLLPEDLPAALTSTDLDKGLAELAAVELVEQAGGGIWETTPKGDWLASEMLSSVSKVGSGVATYRPDGTVGHRTYLFIRTPLHLLLHALDEDAGVIAALTGANLDLFLQEIFGGPEAQPPPELSEVKS